MLLCSDKPCKMKGIALSTVDPPLSWRKSQRCDTGACVEVAELPSGVALRDSTVPDGPTLTFSRSDWAGFVADLRIEDHHAR